MDRRFRPTGQQHHLVAARLPGKGEGVPEHGGRVPAVPAVAAGHHVLDQAEWPGAAGEVRQYEEDAGRDGFAVRFRHEEVRARVRREGLSGGGEGRRIGRLIAVVQVAVQRIDRVEVGRRRLPDRHAGHASPLTA